MKRIGILSLQGDFEAHTAAFRQLGVETVGVRKPDALASIDGLVIPGGESSTLLELMAPWDFLGAIAAFHQRGGALFGTCAGLILLATQVEGTDQQRLGLLDVAVHRNGYGRQRQSFATQVAVPALGDAALDAVFIRAPRILRTGADVEVLATLDDQPVVVRQDRVLAASFHPELTPDTRLQAFFLTL